ncbi:MAG: amino acid adenylation domain-containing protein [Candidatus Promineifilaceae bacterium]
MKDKKTTLLSAEQEALLDQLLAEEGLTSEAATAIPKRPSDAPVPLTYAQSRIWFLEQLTPEGESFVITTAIRLHVPIQPSLLQTALEDIWNQHEMLRATFYVEDGEVWQKTADFSPPTLALIDLFELDAEKQEEAIEEQVQRESRTPFDLTAERLIRASLIRLQANEHIFLITLHHIISDGWSINLLLQELIQSYTNRLAGQEPTQSPLPIHYFDYAAWQVTHPPTDEDQTHLAYWRERLQGNLPVTELPTDYARPATQNFSGAQTALTLPPGLRRSLAELGQKAGATLFMTLLAGFNYLLARQTGQEDIIIGSPVSGRNRPILEGLVGLFVNSLVLRTDLSGSASFLDVLARVQKTSTEAFAHQETAFELLLRELQPERDPGRTPFFQIYFNMLHFDEAETLNIEADFLARPELSANFDLTLYVAEVGEGLELTLVYNKLLFKPERMTDLLQQYRLLLEQVAAGPTRPLNQLSLLTPYAQAVLPDPAAPIDYSWPGPIFARLDEWASIQPGKTAVSDPETRWRYQDVTQSTNRLAHYFQERGIQKGQVVAIYARRSAVLVTAMMGVLKAGAVVLILDPLYPPARLAQYVSLAKPAAWLEFEGMDEPNPTLMSAVLPLVGEKRLTLPTSTARMAALLASYPVTQPTNTVQADDLAFLTFTSGSTGRPKGVACRHRSLTRFYPWMAEAFSLTTEDRFSMLSGLAHDPLQRDILTAIWVGGEICVPDADLLWQPGYLADWLKATEITVTHIIPSMVHALTTSNGKIISADLRLSFFVGEPLTRHLADRFQEMFPDSTVVNIYGSSETQRAVSYHVVKTPANNGSLPKQEIPLGVGMPGAQVLVLTETKQLAGIGELGELYMRSPYLAQGYWGDRTQTAERFLQNPWQRVAYDRLYRTGDWGRFLPDGQVTFAGRQDSQVNIRGYLVELGEIESVLTGREDVASAVVLFQKLSEADAKLIAYLVIEAGYPPEEPEAIRSFVKSKLPSYMVPAAVVFLDEIPLTPNGKIDTAALPDPEIKTAGPGYVPPRNPIEQSLVEIWQGLLKLEKVGVHDDFFTIGGHSILAIQLFSRIEKTWGLMLNVGLLFRAQTIAELGRIIQENLNSKEENTTPSPAVVSNLLRIQEGKPGFPRFYCVHGAGGHVFYMYGWKSHFENWSLYGFFSPGVDGLSFGDVSIETLASNYIANLKQVQPEGPYFLGGYSGGGVLAYEIAQQLQAQGDRVDLLVMIDTHHTSVRSQPFDWHTRISRVLNEPVSLVKSVLERSLYPLKVRYLCARYVRRGQRVPIEHREMLLTYFFVSAKWRYTPKPYDGQVLLIRSLDVIPMYSHVDTTLGWGALIEKLMLAEVPGDHFTVVEEPYSQFLAEAIQDGWYLCSHK